MANDLPTGFILPDATSIEEQGKRSWRIRHSQAAPGKPIIITARSFPAMVIGVIRDLVVPIYANASIIARAYLVRNTFGPPLEAKAKELGLEGFKPATGSTGHVIADSIVVGGAQIPFGTALRHEQSDTRFEVSIGDVYQPGQAIPVRSLDTGPSTNIAADAKLRFNNPPPGVSEFVSVLGQNDGSGTLQGLTGGRPAESDVELQERIIEAQSDPPAAGNVAQMIRVAQATASVPVEKAFVIPAFRGPGSGCVIFTVRPDTTTGSRIPNSVQRGLVEADIRTAFPADNGYTVGTIVSSPLRLLFKIDWRDAATGWVDVVQWPVFVDGVSTHAIDHTVVVTIDGGLAPYTSSSLRLVTNAVGHPAPLVGMMIAFFDLKTRTFQQKRIKTVSNVAAVLPTKKWDLTFEMTAGASSLFIPADGAIACPWSPTLNLLPQAVYDITRRMGPGEQVSTFYDPGVRQRRQPDDATSWPYVLTGVSLGTALRNTRALRDVDVALPTMPHTTPTGVPGVLSYLLELRDLAFYPI